MATPKKTVTITVALPTYSTRDALKQAHAITDTLEESLSAGAILKGISVK